LNIDPNMNTDPNTDLDKNLDTDLNRNTNLGISANILSLIGYLVFPSLPLIAIIAFVIEKDNNFVRFHSLQSMLLAIVEMLLPFIIIFIIIFNTFLLALLQSSINLSSSSLLYILLLFCYLGPSILYLVLTIGLRTFLAIQALRWKYSKLPIIGKYAERAISNNKED